MSNVARQGRRGKKSRVLGEPNVLTLEAFAAMEHDTKAELIQALIPYGLMAVAQTPEAEARALAGEGYRREGSGRKFLAPSSASPSQPRSGGKMDDVDWVDYMDTESEDRRPQSPRRPSRLRKSGAASGSVPDDASRTICSCVPLVPYVP